LLRKSPENLSQIGEIKEAAGRVCVLRRSL